MAGKRMKFIFKGDKEYRTVFLAGDFTDWDKNAIVMDKKKSGEWTYTKSLTFGEHEYKFIADGEWLPDPKGQKKRNEQGIENSVIRVERQ